MLRKHQSISLYNKYDTKEDTSKEQKIYKKAIKAQAEVMVKYADKEIKDLKTLSDMLAL